MKVFGMRIKDVGLEFSSREEREKALITFTRASTVGISEYGIKFDETQAPFGTYERETKEVLVHCSSCRGEFEVGSCGKREYWALDYYKKEAKHEDYICDGCLAAKNRDTEVRKAKAVLGKEGEEEQ